MARTWNPGYHPRDKKGRFTRSATRVMTQADRNRGRKAMEGFAPATFNDAGAARAYLEQVAPNPPAGAADAYLQGDWRDVNTALRAGKTADGVDEIDQQMRPLPDDLMLRRQVPLSLFAHVPMKELEGMKVRDAAYASTSLDVPGHEPNGPGVVTMHIAAPKGTPALVNAADGEILLARDTEVAITRVEPDGRGGWDVYGAVLPKAKTRAARTKPAPSEPSGKTARTDSTTPPAAKDEPPATAAKPQSDAVARIDAATSGRDALASVPGGVTRDDNVLPVDQAAAVRAYRDEDATYRNINGSLRGLVAAEGDTSDLIKKIDAVMADSQLQGDTVTYRGTRNASRMFGAERWSQNLTGAEWREDAFVSTSANQDDASRFFGKLSDEPGAKEHLLMRIISPEGTGAVRASTWNDEAEVLLDRGHPFRVVADRGVDKKGVRHLDVEVLPKAENTSKADTPKVDATPTVGKLDPETPVVEPPADTPNVPAAPAAAPVAAKVDGHPSTEPLAPNTWGEPVKSPADIHFHDDGEIGTAIKAMGADQQMDVDGQPLANVLGHIATDAVLGRITAQQQVDELKALRDRLPEDSNARRSLDGAIARLDAPMTPAPDVPDGTPAPLRDLANALHAVPLVRNEPDQELEPMMQIIADYTSGRLGGRRLVDAVRKLRNRRHESVEGKSEIDAAVSAAVASLESFMKANGPRSLSVK